MEQQLRTEINQIILGLPESKLKSILSYLKRIEQTLEEQNETTKYLDKIFEEDSELLKKLAQ